MIPILTGKLFKGLVQPPSVEDICVSSWNIVSPKAQRNKKNIWDEFGKVGKVGWWKMVERHKELTNQSTGFMAKHSENA